MKKILAILMVVVLLFSALAVPSFALEGETQPPKYDQEDDSFWNKIFSPIKRAFDDFSTAVSNFKTSIVNKFNEYKQQFTDTFDYWGVKIGDWFEGVKKSFYDRIGDINGWFTSVGDAIMLKLEYLFVPTFSFSSKVAEWKEIFDLKFSFVKKIQVLLSRLFNFSETATAPKFEFSFMGAKGGIIDFSAYAPFRTFVHAIILFFAWFSFIKRLWKAVPGIIMNAGDVSSRVQDYSHRGDNE